jgi:threonine/homoserine/homoserine lactone efflux protein
MASLLAFLGVSAILIVTPGQNTALTILLALGIVFCVMTLAWLCTHAYAVARAGDFLRRSRVRRALDAVTGAVLVAFGLRLAAERS